MRAEALLHAAVTDNARWCDIVCGSHGHPGVFTDRAVAALRPGLPVVGYEHGAALAAAREAGCQVLGPLRVWARGPVP